MIGFTLIDPADVHDALSHDALITPEAPDTLGTGSTAALRHAMARFSDGAAHDIPRSTVEQAISRISAEDLTTIAARRTPRHIAETFDARLLACIVPTEALALALGIDEVHLDSVVADVELVVRSIGRGEVATDETDNATDRLSARLTNHPDGHVAAISLLYQVFDSAAALFSVSLVAERTVQSRRNALPKTVRSAATDLTIGRSQHSGRQRSGGLARRIRRRVRGGAASVPGRSPGPCDRRWHVARARRSRVADR